MLEERTRASHPRRLLCFSALFSEPRPPPPPVLRGARVRLSFRQPIDGNKTIKVSLDNPYEVSDKLETFSAVYASLTGKNATFELPAQEE